MQSLFQDLRYGVRVLARRPGFTFVAVITLALGIGVNTALFTLLDVFVLRPLPLKDPDSLVQFSGVNVRGQTLTQVSYLDYLDYRDHNTTLSGLALMNKVALPIGEAPSTRDDLSPLLNDYVFGQIVSASYFDVLGAQMELGRGFLPEDERAPLAPAILVLSYQFWQRQFNGDPHVLGRTIKLHGQVFTVVGVTARDFIGTTPDVPACWIPVMMRDRVIPAGRWNYQRWLTERSAGSFTMFGRLKPGVTTTQTQADLTLIKQRLAEQFPDDQDGTKSLRAKRNPGFISLGADEWASLTPLPVAVALVLLIACANVANLLLARAASRQNEIGVRLALGASRRRIVQQLLTESVLISTIGGLAGLLLASWALNFLSPIILARLPIPPALRDSLALNLDPDYRVFGFTVLMSLVAGIVAGLAPALQASRPDLTAALKGEGAAFGPHLSQSRLRNGLLVMQIAVSLALLIGAGLLVRNLQSMRTIDTGMETKNIFSIAVNSNSPAGDRGPSRQAEVHRQLADRLRARADVVSVSESARQPLAGPPLSTPITLDGQTRGDDRLWRANYNFVSADYFDTLGIAILRGRRFTQQEANAAAPVVVISEATARKFWPDAQDPGDIIGKRIGISAASLKPDADNQTLNRNNGAAPEFPAYEIIGIARDTRSGWVWRKDETYLYVPLTAANPRHDYLLIKTSGAPQRVMAEVADEVGAIEPRLSFITQRLEDSLDLQMTPFRGIAIIASVLGLMALLLAGVGLYGVMAFVVTRRTREIGIRVALGAQTGDIIRLILQQGLRLIVLGIIIGAAGGALVARLLATVLIELSPFDPLAFGGVSAFLAMVALLACYIPARRAAKVDPMVALRYE